MRHRLLRRRPSPTAVIALVALFFSLGGVSYGVATGSIDSREIKNNTVRTQDVRTNALKGKDIANGTVRSAEVGTNALTSVDIAESKLGTVPSAASADGHNFARLNVRLPAGSSTRTVLAFGGLILNATCSAGGDLALTATTASNNSIIHVAAIESGGGGSPHFAQDNDLDVGQSVNALPGGSDDNAQNTLTFTTPEGRIVNVSYLAEELTNGLGSANDCFAVGTASQS